MLCILMIEEVIVENSESFRIATKAMHCLLVGFALFNLFSVIHICFRFSKAKYALLVSIILLTMLAYYFITPHYPIAIHAMRTVGIFVVAHLLLSVAPYYKEKDLNQFWAFNKTIFLRFLEAGLYSLFIYGALSIAIVALTNLFNIHFAFEIYGDLFFLIASLFFPIYFFSRFPKDLEFDVEELKTNAAYNIFSQRIIVPIVFLYALILFAYILKIIFLWSWPRGWISNMSVWFAVSGIFAYLLNYVSDGTKLPNYVRLFKKWFFPVLIPVSIVLLLAIYRRLSDYGVTEPRYIIASVGVWLFLISLYFTISKRDDIRFIPFSLALFVLLATWGPFNLVKVSLKSQMSRLENHLLDGGYLNNNLLQKSLAAESITKSAIVQKLRFLESRESLHLLKKWESGEINIPAKTAEEMRMVGPLIYSSRSHKSETLTDIYNALDLRGDGYRTNNMRHSSYYGNKINLKLTNADFVFQFDTFKNPSVDGGQAMYVSSDFTEFVLEQEGETYSFPISDHATTIEALEENSREENLVQLDYETEIFALTLYFNSLSAKKKDGVLKVMHANGIAVLALK